MLDSITYTVGTVTHADGVVADMSARDSQVSEIDVGLSSKQSPDNWHIGQYLGDGWDAYFPDNYFVRQIHGVDSLTGVGETNNDYLKIAMAPDVGFANATFTVNLADAKESAAIGGLIFRVYLHLNSQQGTYIKFSSLNGNDALTYYTAGHEDEWVDISISGDELDLLLDGDTFSGFWLTVSGATGSGMYVAHGAYDVNPCYMYMDSISYQRKIVVRKTSLTVGQDFTLNYFAEIPTQYIGADVRFKIGNREPIIVIRKEIRQRKNVETYKRRGGIWI